jgi:hypothetical protein
MAAGLQSLVSRLERDRMLDQPDALLPRIEAIDRLDAWLLADEGGVTGCGPPEAAETRARAAALRARLEAANRAGYGTIRDEIRAGGGCATFRRAAELVRGTRPDPGALGEGYDDLDTLVGEVLGFDLAGDTIGDLPEDMVPYQPTPVRHVLDLFDRLALGDRDVLVDLGSGLGQVPLLTGVCTAARGIGVEVDGALVATARRSARGLGLTSVTFMHQDAREADLSTATVVYLYTPFTGEVLRPVLAALRREAATRPLRVCTYGPCTPVVAAEEWLESLDADGPGAVAIMRSRRPPRESRR